MSQQERPRRTPREDRRGFVIFAMRHLGRYFPRTWLPDLRTTQVPTVVSPSPNAGQAGWKPPLPSQAEESVLQLSWIDLDGGASRLTGRSPIFRPGSRGVRLFGR
jgi:hypothetical protein